MGLLGTCKAINIVCVLVSKVDKTHIVGLMNKPDLMNILPEWNLFVSQGLTVETRS